MGTRAGVWWTLALVVSACSGGGASSSGGGGSSSTGGPSWAAEAVTVGFDDLTDATEVGDHYLPHATFSAGAGNAFRSYDLTGINLDPITPPCMGAVQHQSDASDYTLAEEFTVTFPRGAVNLKFTMLGVNTNGAFGQVTVQTASGEARTIPLAGAGNPQTPVEVDLSSQGHVTSMHVHSLSDSYGLGYDNFTFTTVASP
jgi:hypothetical protein